MLDNIVNFLRESKVELKKVSWPTRPEVVNYTIVVILVTLVVALFLGGLDFIFSFILNQFVF